MNTIIVKEGIYTPKIILDRENNIFEISGKSLPEDSYDFYKEIIEWIDWYTENPNKKTTFIFKMIYFNSTSYAYFFDILYKLKKIINKGAALEVLWYYQDGDFDMKESGEEFNYLLNIPIKIMKIKKRRFDNLVM